MPTAFVLINCEKGSENRIIENLSEVYEIREIKPTIGHFDLIAKVTSPSSEQLSHVIMEKICNHNKIRLTKILLRMETAEAA